MHLPSALGAVDEEQIAFDEHREWFVLPDLEPLVLTVRGIRFLKPKLERVGLEIADIRTHEQLGNAIKEWSWLSFIEMENRLRAKATSCHTPSEEKVLWAALNFDIDAAESEMVRLEHLKLSGLHSV